nr:MAG TPA: hypothetical protein [Caudoviricetes sp.]
MPYSLPFNLLVLCITVYFLRGVFKLTVTTKKRNLSSII